jgi:tetratricopeptide (TPR) repeat protein
LSTLDATGPEPPTQHLEHELSIITGYDMTTLREKVDLDAVNERLEELGKLRSLSALNEKVVLLRLSGQLDEAFIIANEAVRQARFSGDREQALGARIRRAQVQQYQGKYAAALQELSLCVEEAQTHEWGTLEATATLSRGKVHFEMKEFEPALVDFKAAVFLMERLGASIDQLESSLVAVAVTESFLSA